MLELFVVILGRVLELVYQNSSENGTASTVHSVFFMRGLRFF